MDLGLEERVALVTGAARGIGRAEAEALAGEGVRVAINDIDAEAAQRTAEEIGGGAAAFPGDVTDEASVDTLVRGVVSHFGRIDILVNNAGIAGRHLGHRVENMAAENWDVIMASHARSTFLCSRAVIEGMRVNGFGRIVNTSSQNYTGGGRPGVANYGAAKAAIAGFTRTLAREVAGYGITVNAIAPGYVETDLIAGYEPRLLEVMREQNPMKRLCQPREVADLVVFLCSVRAAFINGAIVQIDGGKQDFHWG